MKVKLFAVMAFSAVAVSITAAATTGQLKRDDPDETQVQAAIDARLHDLLVQMRMQRAGK
jgi:hypothetical protein